MPYGPGTRLPGESASKLGHLRVIQSEWVQELISDFEFTASTPKDESNTIWNEFDPLSEGLLPRVFAVDGFCSTVSSNDYPRKEVSFVKTALLRMDKAKLDKIDKDSPHPLLLQDVLAQSALYHATVFPLKNIRSKMGSNYEAIRHIVRDSMRVDQGGAYYETLKWLAYLKWTGGRSSSSPGFGCPHCSVEIQGLPFDSDEETCSNCHQTIFLTDMIGFPISTWMKTAPPTAFRPHTC
jgi:hypothetical protein